MNIGPYQQQQKYPQYHVDQSHPLHPPQNENNLGNIPRAVGNENTMKVSPDMNHLSHQIEKLNVQEPHLSNSQFPPTMVDPRNNVSSYENSYQNNQPYLDSANCVRNPAMMHNVARPNAMHSYSNSNEMAGPPQFPYGQNNGSQGWPGSNSFHSQQSMPPTNNYMQPPASINSTPGPLQANQVNNVRPPTLPPTQQYNQKPLQPPPTHQMSHYDPSRPHNGISHDQAGTVPPLPMPGPPSMSAPPMMNSSPAAPYGSVHQQSYLQQSQQMQSQRRLDPDQMPNPIQVMDDDYKLHGNKPFITNSAGLLPPLVSTKVVVEDQGNASPRFIRSTMYSIPCTIDMMKQADVPFSLVITPLATLLQEEQPPPIVDTGALGPVRCVRCKAYVNPYMKFVDGGRRFVCVLCSATTEVPAEYFQHLDHTGQRVDRYGRPELIYGAYEFTVTQEYCKDNELPNMPAIIFIIDVSYNNIKSGMVSLLCEQMSDLVQNYMPTQENDYTNSKNTRMRVGFITYDTNVHFYNIKACLGQPQMMIVGDVEDMFVPLLDGFLCDPVESLTVIQSLMQQIPNTFGNTKETDTLLLPAVQAGLAALKAAKCAGKLMLFHSSLPTGNAPGKLANREDRKLLGTDKEKTLLMPANSSYTSLAQECVNAGCSVDLFILNNSFVDLPTIGQLSKLTGGEIFKYTYFQADIDGDRLIEDIRLNLSRETGFDAVLRVRTSTGTRPVGFYGNIHMTTSTDVELASINADKSIAVEIKHDDKLNEDEGVFIQVALLYTSCFGQRRVRILNLALNCCTQMADLFRNCELDTLINYWSKSAVTKLLEGTPRQVKEGLTTRCARILACYRKLCANPSSPGQLILPECMKLFPLYLNCLLKSDAVSGGSDMTIDDRFFMMQAVSIMDIPSSSNYFYPRMLPLIDVDQDTMPSPTRCTSYKLSNQEAYILENGIYMFLWIGACVPPEWVVSVFEVADVSLININIFKLPVFENIHSRKLNSLIEQIQSERRRRMKLTIVRETDKMEVVFKRFLVEDSTAGSSSADNLSSSSYVDFLCYMHKEIRNILS